MGKMIRSVSLEVPLRIFFAFSQENCVLTTLKLLLYDIITPSYFQITKTNRRDVMTEQPSSNNKTLYEVLAILGHRLLQLSLVFIFYMLGNLLSVGIFVVFFFCSIFVYWLSKKFTIPLDVTMACKGLNLIMLACGLVSAGYLLLWNTYNFIMDVRLELQNRHPE